MDKVYITYLLVIVWGYNIIPRVLIKHFFLYGKTIKKMEGKLKKYYLVSAGWLEMVHKWFMEFRCGRTTAN